MIDLQTIGSWLWDAACIIRGPVDAPKFKDYVLSPVFLKRPSDVFEDEVARLRAEFGGRAQAESLVERNPRPVQFYVPSEAWWLTVARVTASLGQYTNTSSATRNP